MLAIRSLAGNSIVRAGIELVRLLAEGHPQRAALHRLARVLGGDAGRAARAGGAERAEDDGNCDQQRQVAVATGYAHGPPPSSRRRRSSPAGLTTSSSKTDGVLDVDRCSGTSLTPCCAAGGRRHRRSSLWPCRTASAGAVWSRRPYSTGPDPRQSLIDALDAPVGTEVAVPSARASLGKPGRRSGRGCQRNRPRASEPASAGPTNARPA